MIGGFLDYLIFLSNVVWKEKLNGFVNELFEGSPLFIDSSEKIINTGDLFTSKY